MNQSAKSHGKGSQMGAGSVGVRWKVLSGLLVSGLVVSACAPDEALDDDRSDSSAETSAEPTPESTGDGDPGAEGSPGVLDDEDDEPEEVEDPEYVLEDDGFWRANTLPDPVAEVVLESPTGRADGELASAKMQVLSLDSDGDYSRLVLAWLEPDEGERLRPESITALSATSDPYKPWVRLVDRESEELIEPLRADERSFDADAAPDVEDISDNFEDVTVRANCICSSATAGAPQEGSRTYLIFVDFPAPESDAVDVLAGQWAEPLVDVPVTEGEGFEYADDGLSQFAGDHSEPPEVYGAGAKYERRIDLSARSRSLTGVTTIVDQDTVEVSLPADVLFEFGEYSLTSDAGSIIEDAADKLNAEAEGQTVVIEGHTDNVGGHDVNQPLSENRAEAVADEIEPLLDDGISIETEGHSFDQPLVPNEDADGNDLPENRELNRRVSFRYTAVDEDSGTEIDVGYEEIDELPEAEETDTAEGALASYVLSSGEDDDSDLKVRLDFMEADYSGDTTRLRLGIANNSGEYDSNAFLNSRSHGMHFGSNPYFMLGHPTAANLSLVDEDKEQQYFPVTAGPLHCLCTELADDAPGLGPESAPMFAEFKLPDDLSESVTLRIAESNQITLPGEIIEDLTQQ